MLHSAHYFGPWRSSRSLASTYRWLAAWLLSKFSPRASCLASSSSHSIGKVVSLSWFVSIVLSFYFRFWVHYFPVHNHLSDMLFLVYGFCSNYVLFDVRGIWSGIIRWQRLLPGNGMLLLPSASTYLGVCIGLSILGCSFHLVLFVG